MSCYSSLIYQIPFNSVWYPSVLYQLPKYLTPGNLYALVRRYLKLLSLRRNSWKRLSLFCPVEACLAVVVAANSWELRKQEGERCTSLVGDDTVYSEVCASFLVNLSSRQKGRLATVQRFSLLPVTRTYEFVS